MNMCKMMTGHHIKSWFLNTSKGVGLSLDILRFISRRALKRLLPNVYLMLDLFYHKSNPHIMTVVNSSKNI